MLVKTGKTEITISTIETALLLRMYPAGNFILRPKTHAVAARLIELGLLKEEHSRGQHIFSIRPKGVRVVRAIDKMVW